MQTVDGQPGKAFKIRNPQSEIRNLSRNMRRFVWSMAALSAVLLLIALASLCVGQEFIAPDRVLRHIAGALGGHAAHGDPEWVIVTQLRVPRLITGIIAGVCLAAAGVVFQGMLRNPLADPFVLGLSGGAALGVCAGILLRTVVVFGIYSIPVLACAGALGVNALIYYLSRTGARFSIYTMILSGVILNAICSALIMFVMTISTSEQLHSIVFWLMGRLDIADARLLWVVGAASAVASAVLYACARDLNVLTLGEDDAMHLGVNVERMKRVMFITGSLLTACAVSVSGIIGFVGLLVPHFARVLVGPDHRLVLPVSMISGAALLCGADMAARVAIAPAELPVGVVTALVGGPFFLFVLRRRNIVF